MHNEAGKEEKRLPTSVGFIMDGNRRWARERGLQTLEGHKKGYEKLQELMEWVKEFGIPYVTVYALSTENWKRSEEEVSYLMDLFRLILKDGVERLQRDGVRVRFAGDLLLFPEDIQQMMRSSEKETAMSASADVRVLTIAASYGGRLELVHAFNTMHKKMNEDGTAECTEADIEKRLWTSGTPDPDLIIRTGGEQRLSNFLLWQSAYSELMFTQTYWPDFGKAEFSAMLEEYAARERRHGR